MFKASIRFAWRSLGRLTRIALVCAGVALFAVAGAMIALRYWVLPDIGRYHADITAMASRAIGQPVIIGKIVADWSGFRPHLLLTDVRVLDKQGHTALLLPRIDNEVSWMSLLTAELRLHSLEFSQPDLLIKRDTEGFLHIAGVALPDQGTAEISGRAADADWLLHQSRIVVRDARITWVDELRAAPPLILDEVNLVIENGGILENSRLLGGMGQRHQFALHARPPPQLASRLDVRGDVRGLSFSDPGVWEGQLYTQLGYVDLEAWRAWLPLPPGFERGSGAVRGWLAFEHGTAYQLTADLALSNVHARLGDGLPMLEVEAMQGRAGWTGATRDLEISARRLSMRLSDGLEIPSTDFYLRLDSAREGQEEGGEVRANKLELVKFVKLMDFLPLQDELKMRLLDLAPQGVVSELQAKWRGTKEPLKFEVKAHFDEMSLRRSGAVPGFSGLSGSVNGNQSGGTLSMNSSKLTVDAPEFMPEPLAFDTLTAQAGWRVNEQGLEITLGNVFAANEDLAGTLSGSYQFIPHSRGRIDLTVHLSRAAVRHSARYIPLVALKGKAHDWLRTALLEGQSDEFRLRLKGNLEEFPFDNGKGIFQIHARAAGVAIEYAKAWPRVEKAYAELMINGRRLEVNAPAAMTAGGRLQKISVVIPDIVSRGLVLQIGGEAADETQRCLDFIRRSPVRGYTAGFADPFTARGNGILALQLEIPLTADQPAVVNGRYRFLGSDIGLGDRVPLLTQTRGELLFSGSTLQTRNLTAHILGGPAMLQVRGGPGGALQVKASGLISPDTLGNDDYHPVLRHLHGSTTWEAEMTAAGKQFEVRLSSDLAGLTSDLPAPLFKGDAEPLPLRFEWKSVDPHQHMVTMQYGSQLYAKLLNRVDNGVSSIRRGIISFGEPGSWPARDGLWLAGRIPLLSLQGWGSLLDDFGGAAKTGIAGIDLAIGKVSGYGYKGDEVKVSARSRSGVLVAQLSSAAVNGEVRWQPQDDGKLVVRLKNVFLDKDPESKGKIRPAVARSTPLSRTRSGFPAMDVVADNVMLAGNILGRLEVQGQQRDNEWVLEMFRLTNPDGVMAVDGKWLMAENHERTQLAVNLEISNAGNVLARSGYPNTVRYGSGKLNGIFSWPGSPADFSYAALQGQFTIATGKGQFLEIDPGAGKLLSILSLQSLPKHLTLDLADIFSKGFAFDTISGSAQIDHGELTTSDLKIDGSSATVTMQGQVDLINETQKLRVRILPTVGNSMSLLTALVAGPAAGLGLLLTNKLLSEPLDKLASIEYNVTGSWAQPSVERLGRTVLEQ